MDWTLYGWLAVSNLATKMTTLVCFSFIFPPSLFVLCIWYAATHKEVGLRYTTYIDSRVFLIRKNRIQIGGGGAKIKTANKTELYKKGNGRYNMEQINDFQVR